VQDLTDEELVKIYNEGNELAFNELYKRYNNYVVSVISSLVHYDRLDIEDIASDVWRKVVQAIGKFRFEAKFSTWLYQVAKSMTYTHLLKLKNDPLRQVGNTEYNGDACDYSKAVAGTMPCFVSNETVTTWSGKAPISDYSYYVERVEYVVDENLEDDINTFIEIQNQVLRTFPKRYQTSYRLYLNGFTNEEVAELQNVPIGTAKSHIFRTRNAVIKAVKEHYQND